MTSWHVFGCVFHCSSFDLASNVVKQSCVFDVQKAPHSALSMPQNIDKCIFTLFSQYIYFVHEYTICRLSYSVTAKNAKDRAQSSVLSMSCKIHRNAHEQWILKQMLLRIFKIVCDFFCLFALFFRIMANTHHSRSYIPWAQSEPSYSLSWFSLSVSKFSYLDLWESCLGLWCFG